MQAFGRDCNPCCKLTEEARRGSRRSRRESGRSSCNPSSLLHHSSGRRATIVVVLHFAPTPAPTPALLLVLLHLVLLVLLLLLLLLLLLAHTPTMHTTSHNKHNDPSSQCLSVSPPGRPLARSSARASTKRTLRDSEGVGFARTAFFFLFLFFWRNFVKWRILFFSNWQKFRSFFELSPNLTKSSYG